MLASAAKTKGCTVKMHPLALPVFNDRWGQRPSCIVARGFYCAEAVDAAGCCIALNSFSCASNFSCVSTIKCERMA